MAALPNQILPQTVPLGKADKDGYVTIDINWYLLLYNLCRSGLDEDKLSQAPNIIQMFMEDGPDEGLMIPGPTGVQGLPGIPALPIALDGADGEDGMFIGNLSPVTASVSWSAPVTKTADFTIGASETYVINNKAAATCTVTLPAASLYPGRPVTFQNYQAFTVVSNASNVVPLGGGAAGTAILAAVAGNWSKLISDGTNWVIMAAAPNNILLLE
jgi:hypothetical protein